jgi:hypothetical protein
MTLFSATLLTLLFSAIAAVVALLLARKHNKKARAKRGIVTF